MAVCRNKRFNHVHGIQQFVATFLKTKTIISWGEILRSMTKFSFTEVNKGDENPSGGALIDDGFKGFHKTSDGIIGDEVKTGELLIFLFLDKLIRTILLFIV